MHKGIKKKWLKALRSGDYKQTQGRLKNHERYCCLGVLCDVVKNYKHVQGKWHGDIFKCGSGNMDMALPYSVRELVDTDSIGIGTEGTLPTKVKHDGSLRTCLSALNDHGMSFKKIADVIEEQF